MDKNTLKQYRSLLKEIDHLEQEKQRVLDRLLAPSVPDGMPHGSGDQDKIGNAIARRDKYQRMIDSKLDELIDLRAEIECAVACLCSKDRDLIRMRYIDGFRWEKIAVELSYDYRWVLRLHGKILQEMQTDH